MSYRYRKRSKREKFLTRICTINRYYTTGFCITGIKCIIGFTMGFGILLHQYISFRMEIRKNKYKILIKGSLSVWLLLYSAPCQDPVYKIHTLEFHRKRQKNHCCLMKDSRCAACFYLQLLSVIVIAPFINVFNLKAATHSYNNNILIGLRINSVDKIRYNQNNMTNSPSKPLHVPGAEISKRYKLY